MICFRIINHSAVLLSNVVQFPISHSTSRMTSRESVSWDSDTSLRYNFNQNLQK